MISFIVPAHNEQACLGRTLQAIHEAAHLTGRPYEIIVANDASTDATTAIAFLNNARVERVNHRQIAATRNSGGRAARGEYLFFVDADTTVNPRAIAAALRAMDNGAVGGGAPTRLGRNEHVPLYAWLAVFIFVAGSRFVGFTGGAFMFCTRATFCATGGFNERLYCSEEGAFALALKREGRFVVLWESVITSGRRFRTTTGLQVLAIAARAVISPCKMTTQRSSVEKIWYNSNRADDQKVSTSLSARISNGIALLIVIALSTGPIWNFIPRSLTPPNTPLGDLRLVDGTFLCHVGLVYWPIALVLLINMLWQKRRTGIVQSVVLIVFFSWQAWGSTRGVIWFWPWLCRGVTAWVHG